MLELYYAFVDYCIMDCSPFQYLHMDTDSAYIAFGADVLEDLITPELKNIVYKISLNGSQEVTQKRMQILMI